MLRKSTISLLFSVAIIFSLMADESKSSAKSLENAAPDNVKAIIDKSCFGCHNTSSKNKDAKEALDFKKFGELSKIKKISAYKEIGKTIEDDNMPPERFLKKYPDKKLTDEEKQLLLKWTKKEAEAVVKGI